MRELVSINGEIFAPENAKISVYDRGFLFGDAIYEVTRSHGPILLFAEDHVNRLFNSARLIGLELSLTQEEMLTELYRVHKLAEGNDAYLRIQITRGEGSIGLDPRLAKKPNTVIYIKPMSPQDPKRWKEGIQVATTDVIRNSKMSVDPNAKSGNYLNNILAFQKGLALDAAECLMVNRAGEITEGTTSNAFMVVNNQVIGVPDSFDILYGITRAKVREAINACGISYLEHGFRPEDLEKADEVFITSTMREVMPVRQVNQSKVKYAPGPITQKIHAAYRSIIEEYLTKARSHHPWR